MDAIYARQSIDKADSISVESQIEYCKYEVRDHAYCVYADKGYSGKNTDRPQFQKMLNDIRCGAVKRVICYKLDRCSRSILDFAALMEEFHRYQVAFVSCTEKFDTSTPIGRAMLNICIIFAQLERETIQQRVADAYFSRSMKGFYMGGRVPFGYTLAPYEINGKKTFHYVINEHEAIILRKMYAVYERPHTSMGDVIDALSAQGIVHPRNPSGKWTRTYIGRMLRNPIYVRADITIYQHYRNQKIMIHSPPDAFIGINGCFLYTLKNAKDQPEKHFILAPHEGIIASDIWLKCNQKQHRRNLGERANKNSWLVGKMKCAKCGYAMTLNKVTNNKGYVYRYIACSHSVGNGRQCGGVGRRKAEQIEDLTAKSVKEVLQSISEIPIFNTRKMTKKENDLQIQLADIEAEMELLSEKAMSAGAALMKQFSHRCEELALKRTQCLQLLSEAVAEKPMSANKDINYAQEWDLLVVEDKIRILDILVEKLIIDEGTVTIHWKL